jgi:outer membrane protein OmpA-like peptidoglycan-associated protein
LHPRRPSPPATALKKPLVLGASLATLLATGCVVTPDNSNFPNENNEEIEGNNSPSGDPKASNQNALASSTVTSTKLGENLKIETHSLERINDHFLRLHLRIINESNESFPVYDILSDPNDPYTASRVTLVDTENQTRHLSYDQSDGSCFCLIFEEESTMPSGGSIETWVVFPAPPAEVRSMIVTTPVTPPMLDVPITESSESLENSNLAEPEILDLTTISDNLEDQTGRTENSGEVSILLSSDVLFEINSAELSSGAQEILTQVSIEIDAASGTVVNIDGHADNTGSESANLPLSQERAEAVKKALSDLVTRNDIDFSVEGHGSADPIASNETEEGRERNRRVSVTFEN